MKQALKELTKKLLPADSVRYLKKIAGEKTNDLDLCYLNPIRQKDKNYLSCPELLEKELLLKLGLNNESPHLFPDSLHQYCGYGLYHWQYPNQFSKYLVQLSKYKINSYLEIGIRHGGTFLITVEYLKRFNEIKKAIGVDIVHTPSLIAYKKNNPETCFLQADSNSEKFQRFLNKQDVFDLVLIDGNHEEEFCRNDFNLVRDKANIVVVHDIVADDFPGVKKVWQEIKTNYSDLYEIIEFTDQYPSVWEKEKKKFLGIGVAVRKDFQNTSQRK